MTYNCSKKNKECVLLNLFEEIASSSSKYVLRVEWYNKE